MHPTLLILGRGYVGSEFARIFPSSRFTRRNNFQLNDRETWDKELLAPRPHEHVLWTFPAATNLQEENLALELYDTFFLNAKVIIYGTTSSYLVEHPDDWVTEKTRLDMGQVRTRTEERLRSKGACVLHLAGIFGPGRDPLNWYQRGLIKAGLSYLNLIHLDDIVTVTMKLFERDDLSGERFNLSNGRPQTHGQIVDALKAVGWLPPDFTLPAVHKTGSKRVNNEKLRDKLALAAGDFIFFP